MAGCELCMQDHRKTGQAKRENKQYVSLDGFIRRAKKKHGTKFWIDTSRYSCLNDYIKAVCKTCGHQTKVRARKFLERKGCPKCNRTPPPPSTITDEELIKRAIERQDHKFNARLVSRDKTIGKSELELTCKKHEQFSVRKRYGNLNTKITCTICFPEAKKLSAQEKMVETLENKHNRKYQYIALSLVTKTVASICETHGKLTQSISEHKKHGCIYCKRAGQTRLFFDSLSDEQRKGNDYGGVTLKETAFSSQDIEYTCKEHKLPCVQNVAVHLDGRTSCPKCIAEKRSSGIAETYKSRLPQRIKRFLTEAKRMWGENHYTYPNLEQELKTYDDVITIHCMIHDEPFACPAGAHVRGRKSKANYKGRGCPLCKNDTLRNHFQLPFAEVKKAYESRGLTILSNEDEYNNGKSKLKSVCVNNHITWPLVTKVLHKGQGCIYCSGSIGEEITRLWFEDYFGVPFIKERFKPRNGEHQYLELDGYNDDFKIAFEYQGIYHSDPKAHSSEESWLDQQKRDRNTRKMCREMGIELIEIELFNREIFKLADITKELTLAFERVGRTLDSSSFSSLPAIVDEVVKGTKKLQILARICEEHNLSLVSEPVWRGTEHQYDWRCNNCGHAFKNNLYQRRIAKHKCCPKCSRNKGGEKARRTKASQDKNKFLRNFAVKVRDMGVELTTEVWKGSSKEKVYEGKCLTCRQNVPPFNYNQVLKKKKLCGCR